MFLSFSLLQSSLQTLHGSLKFSFSDREYFERLEGPTGLGKQPQKDGQFQSIRNELHESLCDCIRHHQTINECCAKLENLVSSCVLIRILVISFQISMFAISLLLVGGDWTFIVITANKNSFQQTAESSNGSERHECIVHVYLHFGFVSDLPVWTGDPESGKQKYIFSV